MATIPSIAVIGAGPGGLTLARLLQISSIPFTVFDLRPRPSPSAINNSSGSLDLHDESGTRAIKACGLYDEFLKNTRLDAEETRIADKTGKVGYRDEGNPHEKRPEIDRSRLTHLLLESIDSAAIQWSHKIVSVTESDIPSVIGKDNKQWTLTFDGKESQSFDLIIGADGAWSKVRSALTTVVPEYSGVSCITLTIPSVDTTSPTVSETVGRGNLFACSSGLALMSQRGGLAGDYIRTYAMIADPSPSFITTSKLDKMSIPEIKDFLISDPALYGSWSPSLREIITASSTSPTIHEPPKPLFELPHGTTWDSSPNLTLLGDAAHLVTPFAGEGVNSAMLDALRLSEVIVTAVKWGRWEIVTRKYEAAMWKRARETSEQTSEGKRLIFAEDAPKGFVELMESFNRPMILDVGMRLVTWVMAKFKTESRA